MASSGIDVDAETDQLYQLPAAMFIAARNALAGRLKTAGDKDGAAGVRALARPNGAAWAANQAYWQARPEFDAFLESTRRLKEAQLGGGTSLREAMKQRRDALDAVTSRVASLLHAAGLDADPDALRRLSNTLEALAARPAVGNADAPRPGRLVRDLDPPGFEAVTTATLGLPGGGELVSASSSGASEPVRPVDGPRSSALELARAELQEVETRFERASREASDATSAHSLEEKRAQAAQQELRELGQRYEQAKQQAERAAAGARAAGTEAESKAAARDAAEAARDAALRRLRELE